MSILSSERQTRRRSFVRRSGRRTKAQEEAKTELWPIFGLTLEDQGQVEPKEIFGRIAPTFLEIGFGMGHSLLALAKDRPEYNFIGVETHKPGIGALLLGVKIAQVTNLRVYDMDVIDVLKQGLKDQSVDGIQIFFPDPWPKRRHHPRRLIQTDFIDLVIKKLKPEGSLHLATDWEDYALHMMNVLSQETKLINIAGAKQYAERSCYRPILTKFENRAVREGRNIWDLQFRLGKI